MRKNGLSKAEVNTRIEGYLEKDVPWKQVLNSICSQPHPIANEAFHRAIDTNLGDVRIFRGTHELEQEALRLMSSLLNNPGGPGSLVSGGTEGNLLAMFVAKKVAEQRRGKSLNSEVIVAETVHYSLQKIFDMLGLTPRIVPVDKNLRMDLASAAASINDNTIALIGTAGTSEFGSVDPIEQLSELAEKHQLYFHVDAATGGFIIPFARELGHPLPRFDFSLPGVSSITMDPHKYGLVSIPAGGIFFRNHDLHRLISLDSFFSKTPTHRTFLGTRPGAAAHATYAVLEHLGWDGFLEITRTNYANQAYLIQQLEQRGFSLLTPPELNIVIVDLPNALEVMEQLEQWNWIISVSKRFRNCLRLVITQHVDRPMIDAFVAVLEEAMSACGTPVLEVSP